MKAALQSRWPAGRLAALLGATLMAACGGGDTGYQESHEMRRLAATEAGSATIGTLVSVQGVVKISERRLSRTVYEYIFRPTFRNDGPAAVMVEAKLLGAGSGTTIVDDIATLSSIAPNATLAATDTITVRHDRSFPFQPAALVWRVRALPQDPPLVAGVKLHAVPAGRAVVGHTYRGQIRLGPRDTRNTIVNLTIANSTPGGAPPSITGDGSLTWLPNEADFTTTSLRACATQKSSSIDCVDVPVWVTKMRTIAQIPLSGGGSYADPAGRYVVEVHRTPSAEAVEGTLTISEQFDAQGHFTPSYAFSQSGNTIKVLKSPLPMVVASSGVQAASSQRARALSVQAQSLSFPLYYVESIVGSLVNDGINVYSAREDIFMMERGEPKPFPQVEVARVESSCLRSSRNHCSSSKPPVILVHGFTPEPIAMGGGTGTWGELASTLRNRGHHVFELRWMTQMRFEETAGLLVTLGREVAEASGMKPWVIAHSFGGLVSHLALSGDGVIWNKVKQQWQKQPMTTDAERVFAGLVTLGSPLSGINESNSFSDLPVGRYHFDNDINFCASVTCVQAGAADMPLDLLSLQRNVALVVGTTGIKPETGSNEVLKTGESVKRIRDAWTSGRMDWVKPHVHTVVAIRDRPFDDFVIDLRSESAFRLGDGLISMMGQAVDPVDFACAAASAPPYTVAPRYYDFPGCLQKAIPAFLETIDRSPPENSEDILIHAQINDRKYYFATRASHTSFQEGGFSFFIDLEFPRYETNPYPIAKYEPKVVVGEGANGRNYKAAHPLQYFMDKIVVQPTPWVAPARVGRVSGFFRVADSATFPFQMLNPVATLIDAENGTAVSARRVLSVGTDGSFLLDAGAWMRAELGPDARLSRYSVRIQAGDGYALQVLLADSGPLRDDQEVIDFGELVLHKVSKTPALGALSGLLTIDGSGAPVAGADVWVAQGSGLRASEVRALSASSHTGRRLRTGPDGSFSGDSFSPGVYTVVAAKQGVGESVPKSFTLGSGPIRLTLAPQPLPTALLLDEFAGASLDPGVWTIDGWTATGNDYTRGFGRGIGPVSISNGVVDFGRLGRISTKGKVVFSGTGGIVIEGRMAGPGPNRDTTVMLVDADSGDQFMMGDTNYAGFGFYALGVGSYKLKEPSTIGDPTDPLTLGGSTTAFMEYRLTIIGDRIKIERGPTLDNITQRGSGTLGRSIVGRRFHISLGVSWAYYPGQWDWVRVKAEPARTVNPANGHRYELATCGDWNACAAYAVSAGGRLATVKSAAENLWIAENLIARYSNNAHRAAWIGLHRDPNNFDRWLWHGGEPVTYANWYRGEPNNANGTGETAVMIFSGRLPPFQNTNDPGHWNDVVPNSRLWDGSVLNQAVIEFAAPVARQANR